MIDIEEDIRKIEGIERIEIGAGEDGFKLYLERHDGVGVNIPIESDTHDALDRTFMLVEDAGNTGDGQ